MNKKLLEEIKKREEIDPYEHNPCYELVQQTVSLYSKTDSRSFNYDDLNLIYLMTIGTWKSSIKNKISKIKKSNLSNEAKRELITLLKEFDEKSDYIGMFGTGFFTFDKPGSLSLSEVQEFMNILTSVNEIDDENEAINYIDENINKNYNGIGLGTLSQILHCLKPFFFPIVNSAGKAIYKKYGISISSANDITDYADLTRSIKKFRDENFEFKNYRVLDSEAYGEYIENNDKKNIVEETSDEIIEDPTKELNYFWISANPKIWKVSDHLGKVVKYTAIDSEGNKRRIYRNFEEISIGDKFLIYESSPTQQVIATGEIIKSLHINGDKSIIEIKIDDELIDGMTWDEIKTNGFLKESSVVKNGAQGTIFELSEKEYELLIKNNLENLKAFENQYSITLPGPKYESDENLQVNFENSFTFKNKSLVFETGILEALESQISIALRNNKNIILVGPPGTGKSKLAKEICNHYRKSEFNLITANSDWSTFDTIGGYKPQKDGSLKFQPGLFLKQFKNNEMNINRWLIIDEINRADIDKAFGAFFSALAGDQVNLSFEDENGENIVITNDLTDHKNHHYLIHNDWRLIATMNTLDKTSLYEMSYAFMRRFAFISVPSPRNISNELIHRYLSVWKIENKDYVEDIKKVWQLINNYRKIGPALIEDFYKYLVASRGDYASAINMFVIPQLEGVYDDKIIELRDKLSEFDFIKEKDMLKDFINNFFMLEE